MLVYRYYTKYRPPMPGAIPKGAVACEDYGDKRPIPLTNILVWGYADYPRALTPEEVNDYELMYGGKRVIED